MSSGKHIQQRGYLLFHHGVIELAAVEAKGIRIDMERLASTKEWLKKRKKELRDEMESTSVWRQWRKRFGANAKLTSRDQLAQILHVDLGHELTDKTEAGNISVNEKALQKISDPFVAKLLSYFKYDKALGTFLTGIEREVVEGRLHPSYNLHIARSYRSSANDPNFQNYPVRDKEISKIIRSVFVATSDDFCLVENDFKGAEVVVSAAYHKDKNFISYITNPSKDMHRDMAAQIFFLEPKDVTKEIRHEAKNKFVFPQFYGDYYIACAKALWEGIKMRGSKGPDGKSLYENLKQHGIKSLGDLNPEEEPSKGTFERHLKEVEDDFWNRRFMHYGKWRKQWYGEYLDKGYFDMLTGFRVHGSFGRNEVTNYPIQGSAFHCLLWSLIRVNRMLRKYKMRSKIVGQIHDSMLGDVHVKELKDYLCIVEEVVTVHLRKAYEWLIVPLEIECEICPVGASWFDKKETKFKQGRFFHPEHKERYTEDAEKFLRTLKK